MSEEDQESKTENPTDKRLSDYEEEGKVAYSRELPVFASLLVLTIYLGFYAASDASSVAGILGASVTQLAGTGLSSADASKFFIELATGIMSILGPFVAALVIVSTLVAVQNRPRLVAKRIKPEWSRISPVAGFKRLFSANNGFEFLKSFAKIFLAAIVVFLTLDGSFHVLVESVQMAGIESARTILPMTLPTLWKLCAVAGLIAAADFAWQRRTWLASLKMTRQEVKDEFKQSDGDPIIKARLRAIARDRSRKRMMQAVPSATLIIANPTHISVALRYDPSKDAAPLVVAMGADLVAQRIREIAAEHGVPVFERVDLARALYRTVKVNQIIPVKFYAALAELIRLINARARDGR